ncbi:hypothetical protein [Paenibacillus tundrae]
MKRVSKCVCLIFLLMIVTACSKGNEIKKNLYKNEISKENEVFLYNITKQQMGRYNKDRFQWSPLYEQDNLFQYVFGNSSKFVVSGHSSENDFVLLNVSEDKKKITKVLDMENNEDIFFPLADDGKDYYYVLYEDANNADSVKRSIVTFDKNNQVHTLLSTNERITSGIIVNSILYYTVYETEGDSYSVYSLNLNESNEYGNLVKKGLATRELYNLHNELYFSSEDKIFNDSRSFNKKYENFFVNNLLIQVYPDANQDLICTVMDTENNEILGRYNNPVNFEVQNKILYIYCESGIYTLDLGGEAS